MLSMLAGNAVAFAPQSMLSQSRVSQSRVSAMEMKQNPVIIGVAADSGCGKSTFMRRLTSIFGGESKMLDIGRETNTLISDMTTVICLDDYHKWDRTGRASNPEYPNGITALDEKCQDWDKMAADVTDLKAGKTVSKPIYNHITGELDPYEEVPATPIVIFEGLHPLYDSRVNAALDLSIYLDITDEVKFAWKAQRDIAERGATMEDVQKAIDARKPDFKAYVEPQKEKADIVIQASTAHRSTPRTAHTPCRTAALAGQGGRAGLRRPPGHEGRPGGPGEAPQSPCVECGREWRPLAGSARPHHQPSSVVRPLCSHSASAHLTPTPTPTLLRCSCRMWCRTARASSSRSSSSRGRTAPLSRAPTSWTRCATAHTHTHKRHPDPNPWPYPPNPWPYPPDPNRWPTLDAQPAPAPAPAPAPLPGLGHLVDAQRGQARV